MEEDQVSEFKSAIVKVCFVIAPIGEDGSETRLRSNQILDQMIEPAASECGYKVVRADRISQPGMIAIQVIHHLRDDPLVIADLSERNPNVYYELAIRHYVGKPVVQIIKSGEKLPFDIGGMRVIYFDHHNSEIVNRCKNEIVHQIRSIERIGGKMDTPVSVAMEIKPIGAKRSLLEILYEDGKEPYCRRTVARYVSPQTNLDFESRLSPADTVRAEPVLYYSSSVHSVPMNYRLVKVKNIGETTARNCKVRITVSRDSEFSAPLVDGDRVYLQWGDKNADNCTEPKLFDLNPKEEQAMTICHTVRTSPDILLFDDQGKISNARQVNPFRNGTYYLKVHAYCEDGEPAEADFSIVKGEGYENLKMKRFTT
jgi:hypothetical protein